MSRLGTVLFMVLASLVCSPGFGVQSTEPASSAQDIEVRLSAEQVQFNPGDMVRVRVDIRNISSRPILIGRTISTVENWPFNFQLRILDSRGKLAQPINTGFVDPTPRPDLSLENAVLKWWCILEPGYSYGRQFYLPLRTLGPGQYELRGEYFSVGFPESSSIAPQPIKADRWPAAFAGRVASNSVEIQVLASHRN